MKQIMKRLVPFMLAFVLLASCGAFAKAETADDAAEAAALMENIKGTYEALFPVITDPQYDQIWLDPCVAAAGEAAGPQMAEMLKAACNGTIYGQEAIDAFGDGSNGAQFDCAFINGVSTITFDGAVISGADENGNQVEDHIVRNIGGENIELPRISDTEVDQLYGYLSSLKNEAYYDASIENIIVEEAAAFFAGQKSARDVAGVIQSRVQIYINENS